MSPEHLAALEDTLDLLSDPAAFAEIARAREEISSGATVSADQLRAQHLER